MTTIAQHDEAIGDRLHFLDEMRDIDDRQPLLFQASDQFEQAAGIVAPQAARRLVEHEHAAPRREGPRNLDELLRGRRQIADNRVGRDVVMPEHPPHVLERLAPGHEEARDGVPQAMGRERQR